MSLYLRPVRFVDSPIGLPDGSVSRLAGGMLWFAAYEARWRDGRRAVVAIADLAAWIETLPSAEAERARRIHARVTAPRPPLRLGERVIRFDQPQVMGILNVTPDSFSDGGAHVGDPAGAAAAGVAMAAAGAALIDLGGESTKPGAATVWEGDEIARVVPVATRLAAAGVAVSVDTRKAAVMAAALDAGAGIVNDVAALAFDPQALPLVVARGCPVVLMHSPAPTQGPHGGKGYADPLLDVFDWLEARIDAVVAAGVSRERIVVDPGIGFGKALADNLALVNGLALFHGLGCPVLLGASRKRIIGALSNEAPADQRLGGSVALALAGVERGAQIVRVHDVAETVQAIRVWRGLRDAALVAG
ncbi:dihydropteroate synthase [Sphingomonas sp. Leaf25]|uniref:dihydropteroate synthase n=1 Tax=Sphingomonas sp. Leaf25 TaxID=1735692 RepID=UPI0006F7E47B|nr:dihydropteroate synthase [Sphingomonas sp. Leaf25]KQM98822.1 dihydropteroate synthase [Sphingomonas sp. Leaf25]